MTKQLRRTNGAGTVILLVVVSVLFFYKTVLSGLLPVPSDALVGLYHPFRDLFAGEYPRGVPFRNPLITDPVRQQIPWRKTVIDAWKQGRIPSGNPYAFSGTTLAGNIQAAVFAPINILFFILPFPVAWSIGIIVQPVLSGLFLYLYLRSLGLPRMAAVFGGLVWAFSGFSISWMTWGTILHVSMWLPLMLLAIDRILMMPESGKSGNQADTRQTDLVDDRTRMSSRWLWGMVLAAVTSFSFFGGHSQVFLYVLLLALAYTVFRFNHRYSLSALPVLVVATAIFLTMSSIQWLPLAHSLRNSGRILEESSAGKEGWFIPYAHLVQFVVPDFFGNPATGNYWGEWNYGEFIGYVGIVPLLMVLVTVTSLRRGSRQPLKSSFEGQAERWRRMSGTPVFFLVSGVLALFLALPTPLSQLPYLLRVPLLSVMQPTRLLVVVDFSLAVLSAYGLSLLGSITFRHRLGVAIGFLSFMAVLSGGTYAGSRMMQFLPPENVSTILRNLVLPLALAVTGALLIAMYPRTDNSQRQRFGLVLTVGLLVMTVTDLFRFGWKYTPFTDSGYFFPSTEIVRWLSTHTDVPYRMMALDDRILPPNVQEYYGIESVAGYDPVIDRRYEEFIAAAERGNPDISRPFGFNRIVTPKNIGSHLYRLLNVRYVLSLGDLDGVGYRLVMREGETRLYELPDALPRIYLVGRVEPITGDPVTLEHMFSPEFISDPRAVAYVEGGQELDSDIEESVTEVTRYKPGYLTALVQTETESYLVILNPYASDWTVTLNGNPEPVFRTNYLFQGIYVPTGRHTVQLSL